MNCTEPRGHMKLMKSSPERARAPVKDGRRMATAVATVVASVRVSLAETFAILGISFFNLHDTLASPSTFRTAAKIAEALAKPQTARRTCKDLSES